MKAKSRLSAPREYPHLITLGLGTNIRWMISITNELVEAEMPDPHHFNAPGSIDASGQLTDTGKRVIVQALSRRATTSKSTMCMVWGPESCTYFMADGATVDGRTPPEGEPIYPEEYERVAASVRDTRYIVLPEECDVEFICIRRIDADHVEVASGSRMTLGHFDELPLEGPGSELRRHLGEDGTVMPLASFRGTVPTAVSEDNALLGPVQPNGEDTRIVAPWPQLVFAACQEIAGRKLPDVLLQAAWRAVDPIEKGMMLVGVAEAA